MMKKTPEQLKRETADLLAAEREKRRVRQARERRDGAILHAYDRLAADSTEGPNGCVCGFNGDCNCPFVGSR